MNIMGHRGLVLVDLVHSSCMSYRSVEFCYCFCIYSSSFFKNCLIVTLFGFLIFKRTIYNFKPWNGCQSLIAIFQVDNAYWLWSFQGRILKRVALDKFCQLQWRPRPPTLLSAQQQKDIKKSLKKYSAQFEVKDRLKMSKASKVTFFFVFSISKYFLSQFLKFLVNLCLLMSYPQLSYC